MAAPAGAPGTERVDRRSPDTSSALIIPGAAHGYACRTTGAPLAAPFWGSDVVIADAAGRRLIASALVVRVRAARGLYRAAICEQ